MIVIKPLRIKEIDDKSTVIHKAAMFYYDKAINFLEEYNKTGDENKHDIANSYTILARDKMDEWMELRKERDLLEAKPFIFWE